MGKVTEELIALVTKQVQDHGLVVWYDPERAYGDAVDQMHLPETTVLCYQGSFFELRHRLEPLLEFVDETGGFDRNVETMPGCGPYRANLLWYNVFNRPGMPQTRGHAVVRRGRPTRHNGIGPTIKRVSVTNNSETGLRGELLNRPTCDWNTCCTLCSVS